MYIAFLAALMRTATVDAPAPTPPIAVSTPIPIPPAANAAIDKANADWLPAMAARDVVAVTAPYAEDALFTYGDGHSIKGAAAIRAVLAPHLATLGAVVGGGIVSDGRTAEGDLVFEWGHSSISVRDASGTASTPKPAPYLTVWRRSAEGRWLIIRKLIF